MTLLYKPILLLLLVAGCTSKAEKNKSSIRDVAVDGYAASYKHTLNNIQVEIKEIKTCDYPEKDPLYKKKRHKKLLVLQIAVTTKTGATVQNIIPLGAVLTDNKGNSYETSPGVVAMAQSSGCIRGDDLKNYNSIWNGELAKNETITAFVLGFEVPENAIAEKIYWNSG
jgi:hypothetical protein